MVLYGSDGSNYVLPINNVLWQYIGMNIPKNVKNIDYEKAKCDFIDMGIYNKRKNDCKSGLGFNW